MMEKIGVDEAGAARPAWVWPAAFLLAGLLACFSVYRSHHAAVLYETEDLLGSVARLKVEDVARWRQERVGDMLGLARSHLLLSAVRSELAGAGDRGEISERLRHFIEAKKYSAAAIVLPSGEPLAEAGDLHRLSPEELKPLLAGLKGENDASLGALFFCPVHNKVHMRLAVGFFSGRRLLAALVLRREPEEYLFPMIQKWPGVSATAETLLVEERGGRVMYLNDLRHRKDAAVRFTAEMRPDLPAGRTLLGMDGFLEGRDYRGVRVYAYTLPVPASRWHLVSKIDAAEVEGRSRSALLLSLLLVLLVLGAGVYGVFGLLRRHGEASRRLAARYSAALADSGDTMALVELDSRRMVETNAACLKMYGLTREEFLRLRADELRPPEYRVDLSAAFGRLRAEKAMTYRTIHVKKGGARFPVEVRLRLVELDGREYAHAVMRDVSEQDLRCEAETRLAAALESMTDAVLIADTAGRFVIFNQAFAAFHKFGSKGECARTLGEYTGLFELFAPDGTPVPLERWALPRALRGETVSAAEYKLRRRDTGETWHGSYSFAPIRDAAGAITGAVAVSRDITEKKRSEQRILDLNAALLDKNREMEDFLYVTTHDLRSPLVNIQGFSENLAGYFEELKRDPALAGAGGRAGALLQKKIPGALGYVTESAAKMDRLIKTLLQISRAGRVGARKERVDMNSLLAHISSYFSFQLGKLGGEVAAGDLPPCLGDRDQINQIFSNLIENAIKYRAGERPPRVAVSGALTDGKAVYEVRDNGIGIEASQMEKIWKLFYRVSGQPGAGGEGLGLPLVKLLAEKNGGAVSVESTPGSGSAFRVALPAVGEEE